MTSLTAYRTNWRHHRSVSLGRHGQNITWSRELRPLSHLMSCCFSICVFVSLTDILNCCVQVVEVPASTRIRHICQPIQRSYICQWISTSVNFTLISWFIVEFYTRNTCWANPMLKQKFVLGGTHYIWVPLQIHIQPWKLIIYSL